MFTFRNNLLISDTYEVRSIFLYYVQSNPPPPKKNPTNNVTFILLHAIIH